MILFCYVYKVIRKVKNVFCRFVDKITTCLILYGNNVSFCLFRTSGVPYVMVARGAKGMTIGHDFAMNNGIKGNPIGSYDRCTFFVDKGAEIVIGDHVGISQTALISHCSIRIGNNVKIGGGTCVYTTDFHSLEPVIRASKEDMNHRKCAPVIIGDNAFIGARCIILKGVTIGENSIIGAGSVVTKSVPANQIWAGNPARFIRMLGL